MQACIHQNQGLVGHGDLLAVPFPPSLYVYIFPWFWRNCARADSESTSEQ